MKLHLLKKLFFLCCAFLLFLPQKSNGQALPDRYRTQVFANTIHMPDIRYASNVSIPTGGNIAGFQVQPDESATTTANLDLDIFLPGNFLPAHGGGLDTLTKRPVVIFCFGGGFLIGDKDDWDAQQMSRQLAERGFVTAAIDYRLGMNIFDEDLAMRAVYRGIQDGRAAVRYFKANAAVLGIDTNQIYIGGHSAGGFIALHNAFLDKEFERPASTYDWSYGCGFLGLSTCTAPDLGCLDCSGDNIGFNGEANVVFGLAGALGFLSNIEGPADPPTLLFHSTDDAVIPYYNGTPFLSGLGFLGGALSVIVDIPTVYGSGDIQPELNNDGVTNEFYSYTTREHSLHKFDVNGNGDREDDTTLWANIVPDVSEFMYQHRLKPLSTALSGATSVCGSASVTETYTLDHNDFYYDWNITGGTFVTPLATRQYSNTVTVTWAPGAGPRTLTVTPYSRHLARGENLISLSVSPITDPDVAVTQLLYPPTTGCEHLSNAEQVTVEIQNASTCVPLPAGTSFDVVFTESTTGANFTETVTLTAPLTPGAVLNYSTSTTLDLSAPNTYIFNVDANLTGDANTGNDLLIHTIVNYPIPAAPAASNVQSCVGSAVPDLTATGTNLTWYDDVALTNVVATGSPFATGQSAVGTYTYYVTQSANGCESPAQTVTLTIDPLPVVGFGTLADVCLDAAAFPLTTGSPAGGTYSGPGVDGSGNFNPATAGAGVHTLTYSYTDGNGCTNTATQTQTVHALPIVDFTALGDVCEDAAAFPLTTGSPTGGTYSGPGVDGSGNFNPATAGAGVHTLTYSYTDGNGCTNTAIQTQTVHALPAAPVAASQTVCEINPTPDLTATGTNINWYSDAALTTNVHSGNTLATGLTAPGSYTFYLTQTTNGCEGPASSVTLVILPAEVFYADTDGDGFGDPSSAPITDCTAPAGYVNNDQDCDDTDPNISPAEAEVCGDGIDNNCNGRIDECAPPVPPLFPVQGIAATGISESQIRVHWFDFNASEHGFYLYRSIGSGDFIQIAVVPPSQGDTVIYVDTDLQPDTQYHYFVRAFEGTRVSTHSDQAEDFTYPLPPVLNSTTVGCVGSSGEIRVSGTHRSGKYRWFSENTPSATPLRVGNAPYSAETFRTAALQDSATYFVAAQGQRYLSAKLAVGLVPQTPPEATLSRDGAEVVCQSATLRTEDLPGRTYRWFRNGVEIAHDQATLQATQSGEYRVEVLEGVCKVQTNTQSVKVVEPEAVKILTTQRDFCATATLEAADVLGATFRWEDENGQVLSQTRTLNTNASGTYRFFAQFEDCEQVRETEIEVWDLPSDPEILASATTLCPDETLRLESGFTQNGLRYVWLRNGRSFGDEAILETRATGEYVLRLLGPDGCAAESAPLQITRLPDPKPRLHYDGEEIELFLLDDQHLQTVRWLQDGQEIAAWQNLRRVRPEAEGLYEARLTLTEGCELEPPYPVRHRIQAVLGDEAEDPTELLPTQLWPNPAHTQLNLRLGSMHEGAVKLEIVDLTGRRISTWQTENKELSLPLHKLATGTYVLRIRSANHEEQVRFVKE